MPTDARGRLSAGTTLAGGIFVIDAVLGQGGTGITYKARQTAPRRPVAVKEFYPLDFVHRHGAAVVPRPTSSPEEFEELKKMFRREADALAGFNHPSIVHVHQVFEENATVYMVLEFLDGKTLGELAPMADPAALMAWLDPVCDALAQVHERRILHRDISPQNVIMRGTGVPALLDFGAARIDGPDLTRVVTSFTSYRDSFSPPEQYASAAEHTPATDIYALCATAYFTATGQKPPEATLRQTQVMNGGADPLRPLAELVPAYPARLAAAIDAGLALRRDLRPQSIAEFRDMMGAAGSARLNRAAAPEPRRRGGLRKLAAVAALPVAAAAAWAVVVFTGEAPQAGAALVSPAGETWRRVFSDAGDATLTALAELPDGGFIVAGHTTDGAFGGQDGWAIRVNPEGRELWRSTFGSPGDDTFTGLVAAGGGDVVLSGITFGSGTGQDGWAMRIDSEGRKVWARTLGAGEADGFAAVEALSDGGFGLGGWSGDVSDGWAVRLDAAGAPLWEARSGGPGADRLHGIAETPGGGLVLAGTRDDAGTPMAWAVRLDAAGVEEWQHHHGGEGGAAGFAAVTAGAGVAAGTAEAAEAVPDEISVAGWIEEPGSGNRDAWMMRLGTGGAELWRRRIGASGVEHFNGLARLPDGGIILAGWIEDTPGGDRDALAVRLDAQGVPLWQRRIGGEGEQMFHAVVLRSAGGVAFAGHEANLVNLTTDGWLVLLDPDGRDLEGGPDTGS